MTDKNRPTCEFLFVYGTLRCNGNNDLRQLLTSYADFIDDACYQGKLYLIDYYPGVVASDNPLDRVKGEVYYLHKPNFVLSQLDVYEECSSDFVQPTEYIREIKSVQLANGKTIPAWLYTYNFGTENLKPIVSGDFLKIKNTTHL